MESVKEQIIWVKFCLKVRKINEETHSMLCKEYGDDTCFVSLQENTIGVVCLQVKEKLHVFFYYQGVKHYEFAPEGHTVKSFI
jgi:hypothetical protein